MKQIYYPVLEALFAVKDRMMKSGEAINHPPHYGGADNPYEVIKVLHAWGLNNSFPLGSAVKYIARAGKKEATTYLEDLEKAAWYLNWEINRIKEYQQMMERGHDSVDRD